MVVSVPRQKAAERSLTNGKILTVLFHSFLKIHVPPDGTRQFYVLIGNGLGRNPGLTAGAGPSVFYHSARSGQNASCCTNF